MAEWSGKSDNGDETEDFPFSPHALWKIVMQHAALRMQNSYKHHTPQHSFAEAYIGH